MRKIALLVCCLSLVAACDKHDPILPGQRTAIFAGSELTILNQSIENLPDNIPEQKNTACPYTQDLSNVIWRGDKKIFSGFPTNNSVKSSQRPTCSGKYIYAGLTTGELVKINPSSRQVVWIADIYRASNLTGGASVLDIIAPIVVDGSYVYAGGLGDAFCKVSASSGAKKWCSDISVSQPFIIAGPAAFVMGADNYLYAVRLSDGAIYWRTDIGLQAAPEYKDKIITVYDMKINAETGKVIKK